MKSISAIYMTGLEISAYVTLHGMCIPIILLIATNRTEVKLYGQNITSYYWPSMTIPNKNNFKTLKGYSVGVNQKQHNDKKRK